MKKQRTIISLGIICCLLFAASSIDALDQQPAEVISESFYWQLNVEGDQTLTMKRAVIINDEAGRDVFADPRFLYDERCETVEPVSVVTINADGRTYPAPATALNRLTPSGFDRAPYFSHYRELICSFVGVDFGATLQYETRRQRGKSCESAGALEFRQTIGYREPSRQVILSVSLPANKPVFHGTARSSIKPEMLTEQGMTTLQWTFTTLPAMAEEFHSPSSTDILPVVVLSTHANWDEALRPLRQDLFSAAAVPAVIAEKARQLIADARTPEDKITALITWVTTVFHTVHSPVFEGYVQTRPVADIYQANSGQPWERLALFCSLVRALGASFDIVLSGPADTVFEHVPTLHQFPNHGCIVHFDQADWWVSLEDESLYWRPERHQDITMMRVTADAHQFIPRTAGGVSGGSVSLDVKATIDEADKMEGHLGLVQQGIPDSRAEASDDATGALTASAVFKGDIEVKDVLVKELSENRVSLAGSFSYQIDVIDLSKKHRKMVLPQSAAEKELRDLHLPDTARLHPLQVPGPIQVRKTITITLPDDWRIVRLPATIDIANEAGHSTQHVTLTGTELVVTSETCLKKAVYTPEEYQLVRAVLTPFQRDTCTSLIMTEAE